MSSVTDEGWQIAMVRAMADSTGLVWGITASRIEALQWILDEYDDYERLFALQRTRTGKADELWRKAHPEKAHTIPDLGDLLEWLMAQPEVAASAMLDRVRDSLLARSEGRNEGGDEVVMRLVDTIANKPLQTVFTPEEVLSLNNYQEAGFLHPFTCGGDRIKHPDGEGRLVATIYGWVCPYCDYRQNWAHEWMKNGSWRNHVMGNPEGAK